ncbi:MAG TPA: hypothetical protein VGD26_02615 [Chitinophagaceae bacterium]
MAAEIFDSIVIVGNEVCRKSIEYCDLRHEHEEVIPLKHGPLTKQAYEWNTTIAKMYSPILEKQLEAFAKFSRLMGEAFDKRMP